MKTALAYALDKARQVVTPAGEAATPAPRSAIGADRWLRGHKLGLLVVVVVPTILVGLYLLFVATDQYVSEARFTIRGGQETFVPGPEFALLAGLGASSRDDSLIVHDYLLSQDLLDELDRQFDLRAMFAAPDIDVFTRLAGDASREDFLDYWRGRIEVQYDERSGISMVRLRGFTQDDARRVLETALTAGERLINDISHRIAEESLRFSNEELRRQEERVTQARTALTGFQNRTEVVDPNAATATILGLVGELEASLAKERAALSELRTYLREDSLRVKNTQARIRALEEQVKAETARLAGAKGSEINTLAADFARLQAELEFATQAYRMALSAAETARIDAQKKQKHMVTVVRPNLPDEATYPRRLYWLATLLALLLAVYGVGTMTLATIKDHMR